MTGSFWLDLLVPVVTAVLGALAARYGFKLPTLPSVPPVKQPDPPALPAPDKK